MDSLEYAFQPERGHVLTSRPGVPGESEADADQIPLAKPVIGEREEELVLEVLRSGRLSLGPVQERFEREFAELPRRRPTRSRSPRAPPALHLGVRALGWGEGDEVVTSPFSFVASANCLLYEGATPVFCDVDPVTLNLDPAARLGRDRRAHRGPAAGRHPRLPGGGARAREGRRRGRPRAARGRLRGARRPRLRGSPGRLARQPRRVRLLRQQADDDGGGGHARASPTPRSPRACAASATRAARRTWAGSTTTGSASTTG